MKTIFFSIFLLTAGGLCLFAQDGKPNLIPNGDFQAADPLEGWRIDFPYEPHYVENVNYIRMSDKKTPEGLPAVVVDLPPIVAGFQGGKIESALFPAVPGATYGVAIDCLTWDFEIRLHVEAWVQDPNPPDEPSKFRIPARDGMPALVMCYRAQIPPVKRMSKEWATAQREFTLPKTVQVGGVPLEPEFLSVKAYVYLGTTRAGQSYFANFRLWIIDKP